MTYINLVGVVPTFWTEEATKMPPSLEFITRSLKQRFRRQLQESKLSNPIRGLSRNRFSRLARYQNL
jgi:hypothetical protein